MRNLVFILLLAISASVYSQTEFPKDSFPPLKKKPIRMNEQLDNYLNLDRSQDNFSNQDKTYELLKPATELKKYELNIPPLDVYVGPPNEANTFSRNPFINDYTFRGGYIINDELWLKSLSLRSTNPSLGAMNLVDIQLNYQPVDWLIMSGGTYGSKYSLYGFNYNDFGFNGALKFIPHDRIRFNVYGQYSINARSNDVPSMMGIYPTTHYGGTIEFKITEKFGVEGGMIRELNPFNGKWENRPIVRPTFYIK